MDLSNRELLAPAGPVRPNEPPSAATPIAFSPEAQSPRALTSISVATQHHSAVAATLRRRAWPIAALLLAVALVGTGVYSLSTTSRLTDTQAALDSANAKVTAGDASLAASQLHVSQLQSSVDLQKACVAAQEADAADFLALNSAQMDLYNLTATGSPLTLARNARLTALLNMTDFGSTAYNALLRGDQVTAEAYTSRFNSEAKVAAGLVTTINAEVAKVDAALQKVEVSEGVLAAQRERTASVCATSSAPAD